MRKLTTYLIILGAGLWVGWCASQALSRGSAVTLDVLRQGQRIKLTLTVDIISC
jgi:hypothetical protein